jgi:hypothetical protein
LIAREGIVFFLGIKVLTTFLGLGDMPGIGCNNLYFAKLYYVPYNLFRIIIAQLSLWAKLLFMPILTNGVTQK